MLVKGIIDTDIVNYKKISMTIEFPYCSFKCDKDCGRTVCQNSPLVSEPNIDVSIEEVCERYLNNSMTEAIILQGLEPFDSQKDLINLICTLRNQYGCNDDIVIYTGYTKEEVEDFILNDIYPSLGDTFSGNIKVIRLLKTLGNIVIKYGRYIPDQEPHFDEVLGVNLASDNQYAERL